MAHEMNHAAEVRTFNQKHKELVARGEDTLTLQTSWVNLHLSFAGLQQLGADGLDAPRIGRARSHQTAASPSTPS